MVPDVGGRLLRYRNTAQHEEALTSSPTTQKAKRLASKVSVSAFDSQVGYVNIDELVTASEAAEAANVASCEEVCCTSGPRWTVEERAARKERRRYSYEKATELLIEAAAAARDDNTDRAKVLAEIANAWDSIGY